MWGWISQSNITSKAKFEIWETPYCARHINKCIFIEGLSRWWNSHQYINIPLLHIEIKKNHVRHCLILRSYDMAIFISHPILIWDTHISQRVIADPLLVYPCFNWYCVRSLKNCNWNWSIEGIQLLLFTGESYCWTFKLFIVWLEERSQSLID